MVRAARKVCKYLITTASEGVGYSPEAEAEFDQIYSELLPTGRDLPNVNIFSDAGFANCIKTMRSTSGSICYYRSVPIFWRTGRQTVRSYSTAESEYIAASDTIVLSEQNSYLNFFDKLPTTVVDPQNGLSPSLENAILWVDNQSAIITAKSADTKPKSRHYALRYLRVKDNADKIIFCPTTLMKADSLTKLECSVSQRRLTLHHTYNPILDSDSLSDDESDNDDLVQVTFEDPLVYSVFFGF
jgi:hypothetical protein